MAMSLMKNICYNLELIIGQNEAAALLYIAEQS